MSVNPGDTIAVWFSCGAASAIAARADQSRRMGAKLVRVNNKRIFLDELSPDAKGRPLKEIKMPECGIFCEEHS